MSKHHSTRVKAPASRVLPGGPPQLSPELMKIDTQSSFRDGTSPIQPPRLHPERSCLMDLRNHIRIASWNVLTLSDTGYQTALQSSLAAHKIDIACLSETRIPGSGSHRVNSHTLVYSGGTTRTNGVAVMLSPVMARAMVSWRAVSDRLLLVRLQHRHGFLTIISVYAPTDPSDFATKDSFYDTLLDLVVHVPPHDKLIVAGDLNAVSGTDRACLETVVGPYGSGVRNDNSARLLSFCASGGLAIIGSWFKRRNIYRWSWISPDQSTKKEIDHFLLRDRRDVLSLRVMRGIEPPANSDHRLVLMRFKIVFPFAKTRSAAPRSIDPSKLNDLAIRTAFRLKLSNRFSALSSLSDDDPDSLCTTISESIYNVACTTIPADRHAHKPWLSTHSIKLLDRKRLATLQSDTALRGNLQRAFKDSARQDKAAYLDNLADQAIEADRMHDSKRLYKIIRNISGSKKSNDAAHIHRPDGGPCDSMSEVLRTWDEHFGQALNHPPSSNPWSATNLTLPLPDPIPPPSADDISRCIRKLRTGRAPGPDGITAELLISSSDIVVPYLWQLFSLVWQSGVTPKSWRVGNIIPLYKGKGSKQSCSNYRPITLLSVIGKLFASILLERLHDKLLQIRRPQQSGFTPGRSTNDAILTMRLLSDLHRQFHKPLYVAYVDFKAAFDSVDRSALWSALTSVGLPHPIVNLVIDLHTATSSTVSIGRNLSSSFQTLSGVRQGCVLAPALFCLIMDFVLSAARPSSINLAGAAFSDLVYADDVALVDYSLDSLSLSLSRLQTEASRFGLNVSWTKTKLQNVGYGPPAVAIKSQSGIVESVTEFTYLGCSFESNASSHHEVVRRIALAASVMKSLACVWKQNLTTHLKLKLYSSLVLPVLLYASDTWTILEADARRLQSFHMQCQRRILNIRWYDLVSNVSVAEKTGLPPVLDTIRSRRLSLFGHIARLPDGVPAHSALFLAADVATGTKLPDGWHRPRGRPCKSWLAQIAADVPLPLEDILASALDRTRWREDVMASSYTNN